MNKYNQSKHNFYFIIVILFVLGIGIGYAVLSERLTIDNTISYDSMKWDIGFTSTSDNGGSVTSIPTISSDKKSITISCDLGTSTKSETCIAKATITNNSTFDITLNEIPTINYDNTYIESIEVRWDNHTTLDNANFSNNDYIKKNKSEDILIKITTKELSNNTLPSTTTSIPISLTMNWQQSTTEIPSLIQKLSGDGTRAGSELKIGEEHFYIVSNDGTNAVLLAKYNLEVGKSCVLNRGYQCTAIENPSSLQSEKAIGYTSSGYSTTGNYGVVAYSQTNYWYSEGLKSEYGTSYPAYVYDENSNIKTYVDSYRNYLESLGLSIKEARIIKQEELVGLGCSTTNYDCFNAPSWVFSTSYWSSSANDEYFIWYVYSDNTFFNFDYANKWDFGVRPVIVIPSSEI